MSCFVKIVTPNPLANINIDPLGQSPVKIHPKSDPQKLFFKTIKI